MKFIDLVPPAFPKIINKFSNTNTKIFSTFSQAEKECGNYNDSDIAKVVLSKTKNFISTLNEIIEDENTLQKLLVFNTTLNALKTKPLNIFEIGGACGAFFYLINKFSPSHINKWYIVETSEMVKAAKNAFTVPRLFFEDDYDTALLKFTEQKDLLIAQGVIQYVPDAQKFIHKIFQSNFEFIYLSRTSMIIEKINPIISFQKTPLLNHGIGKLKGDIITNKKIVVPVTYIPYDFIIEQINFYNYKIIFQFIENKPIDFKISRKKDIHIQDFGFLLYKIKK